MQHAKTCPDCGSPIPPDAERGLCPRCVFGLAGAQDGQAQLTQESATPVDDGPTRVSGPAEGSPVSTEGAPSLGTFGDYQLLEEIARGGMGVVYRARQKSLGRMVAVKTILAGQFAGKQIAQRFRSEAGAAAVLQHPNIVAVHEVGVHEGVHFFSMDYVSGPNLAQLVGNRPLLAPQAARYTQHIAEAIHYAHQQGILHRDLKPSNVLIDPATDQPRVTDFGLAKRLDTESSLTVSGQVLGSPNFMPPEQAGGRKDKVGRTSDVYGIGGILYYLLTARAPFQGETLEGVITQVIHSEPISPRLLNPAVPRDLETICLKCLGKEPDKRYATAKDLADDFTRFLKHEPIHARPVGISGKTWRWCRRRPALASLTAAVFVLLLTLGIGAPIVAFRIDRDRAQLERQVYAADIRRAHADLENGYLEGARQRLRKYLPLGASRELRGFEWRLLWDWTRPGEHSIQWQGTAKLNASSLSPDGTRLALVEGDFTIHVLELPSARHLKTLTGFTTRIGVLGISFSPNGKWLAAKGGKLRVWSTDTWAEVTAPIQGADPMVSPCDAVAFSPDSTTIAMRALEGGAGVWSTESWKRLTDIPSANPVYPRAFAQLMAYSRDGKLLAASDFNAIRILRAGSFEFVTNLGPATLTPVFFHDTVQALGWSSNHLAAGYRDGTLAIWDSSTWRLRAAFKAHPRGWLQALDFSPDGKLLATGGGDDVIKLWSVARFAASTGPGEKPHASASLIGHGNGLLALKFLAAGDRLISSSQDGTLRLWSNWRLDEGSVLAGTQFPSGYQSNGMALVCLHTDGTHQLWDPRSRRSLGPLTLPPYDSNVFPSILSPDGDTLALCSSNRLSLWSVSRQSELAVFDTTPSQVAFSPAGDWVAAATEESKDSFLQAWDIRSSLEVFRSKECVTSFAFSPDGHWLAMSPSAGGVTLWDIKAKRLRTIDGLRGKYQFVSFSPDSRMLAVHGGHVALSRSIWLVNLPSGRVSGPLSAPAMLSSSVFTPDGRTLISRDADNNITFWNIVTQQELMTVARPSSFNFLVLSPDGNSLALKAPADRADIGQVEIWSPPTIETIDSENRGSTLSSRR